MTTLQNIQKLGQSLWYDNMRRGLIDSGAFGQLISDGITGVTSNPAIFAAAISKSTDYNTAVSQAVAQGIREPKALYEHLAIDDIRRAADLFKPVYDRSHAHDGYVSLEVSPHLAHDTEGTVAEAVRLHGTVGRPNLMIKVPATAAGLPAITRLIAQGISVNVTLLFAVGAYEQVADAYMKGLEQRLAEKKPVASIASVASFFVSRIDTLVDELLGKKTGFDSLKGQIAIANAYEAYASFLKLEASSRWKQLASAGAQPQRLLWASTSTKNPAYPKTMYVDALIAEKTVNTIPPETVTALLESPAQQRGRFSDQWDACIKSARTKLEQLDKAGISLTKVTDQLLEEAIKKFAEPFDQLLGNLEQKASNQ